MSSLRRHFLGWNKPFLNEASNWLQEHHLQQTVGENNNLLILVSGQEVARRLKSILVGNAAKEGKAIVLPPIETTSQCLARFKEKGEVIADSVTACIATASVLRSMPPEIVESIVGMKRPDINDTTAWFAIAEQVCLQLSTLSGGGISPNSSTWPDNAQAVLTDGAETRFASLHAIQQQVHSILLEDGLHLHETKCLKLLDETQQMNVGNVQHVVLIGTTDLPGMVIKMLDRLCEFGVSVESLIRAPETESTAFDTYGCVDVNYWSEAIIDFPDNCIKVAGSPSSQAASVIRELESVSNSYAADQIIIGSTDEKLVPIIQRHLTGQGVKNRFAGGKPILQTPPAVFLKAVSNLVQLQTFSAYSAFVRHPDISSLLELKESTLKALDSFSMDFVPEFVNSEKWFVPKRKMHGIDELVSLHERTFGLLKQCIQFQDSRVSIDLCAAAIRTLLLDIYGTEILDRSDPKFVSLQKIFGVLDCLESLPSKLSKQVAEVDASTLIGIVLKQLESTTIPEYPDQGAIETVGWLESMAVDTPCLIVVGMSADLVGGNNPGDAFFPDTLRSALGLETIDRRLARDAHSMMAMQSMRAENGKLIWIVARTNTDGDPLTPSPLLLRCSDSKVLAYRAKRLVVSLDREEPEVPKQFMPEKVGVGLPIPRPEQFEFEPVERISVTAFKDYIACPYRFWLKHVLRLRVVEDGGTELDPKLFGSLVHRTVEQFGLDISVRDSCNALEIKKTLSVYLDSVVDTMFGTEISGAMRVQVELARFRLGEVAVHLANSAKEGWHILCTEKKLSKEIIIEGKAMFLSGVIDRVDIHDDGRIRILDYKTGGATANEVHFKKKDGEWIDLQLPLYRLLLSEIPELAGKDMSDENVLLGYFRIGDQEATTGINLLDLPDEAMATVDDVFSTIMLDIQQGNFGEIPTDPAPKYSDDFAWICQDNSIVEETDGDD